MKQGNKSWLASLGRVISGLRKQSMDAEPS